MAVDRAVTRAILSEELTAMGSIGAWYNWELAPDLPDLKLSIKMRAHNSDLFILEIDFENYKEWPPFFEFADPDSGQRGARRAYPSSTDSFFHGSGPCICAPFNRKAYRHVVATGPHPDWSFGDWMTSRANNYDWSRANTLGDMLLMIQTRLATPDLYKGRMQ